MSIRQSANEGVIRYLERNVRAGDVPDVRPPRKEPSDYWECGAHPDIVERVWDGLGKRLPMECRQVVLGAPALIAPYSHVILAVAIGTQYAVRLPASVLRDGLPEGARTLTTWSGGGQMDVQKEFGPDWVFGTWSSAEEEWCVQTSLDHKTQTASDK